MSGELGETSDPKTLIPGDPEAVEDQTRVVRERAREVLEAGQALQRIDTGAWRGPAYKTWQTHHDTDVPRWLHAGDALEAAAAAMEEYSAVLRWAQRQAAEAIHVWQQGEAATRQAKVIHDQAAGAPAAPNSGGGEFPATPAFSDPGEEQRQAARDMLARARAGLVDAADRAAQVLESEAGTAPQDTQAQANANFYGAIGESLASPFVSIGELFTDPAGTFSAFAQNVTRPVQTLGDAVAWDDWANGRGDRALGKLTGDFLLTVGTGGVGKIAKTLLARPDGPPSIRENGRDPERERVPDKDRNDRGDPIDIATGEMVLSQTDVELGGVLALVLKRLHVSSYRVGRHFGATWASTVDQRLEVDDEGVCFAADDGTLLFYPHPSPERPVMPRTGPRKELSRADDGSYTVTDVDQERLWHFAAGDTVLPLTAITGRNGHRIDIERDEADTPVEIRHSGGYRIGVDSEDGLVTALSLRDADEGNDVLLMRYRYEAGRLTEVINASGVPLRFTYDDSGRITGWTDRNDAWYRYTYDEQGRVVQAEGSGGFFSGTMAYAPDEGATYWTNSLGQRTTFHLNGKGQTLREIDPLGNEVQYEWDAGDRLLSRTDALGRVIRYDYDDAGNLATTTRPDGSQVRVEYNDLGLPTVVTAPDGSVSRREYDERGNPIRLIDPVGAVTAYTRDGTGHLAGVTDALGNTRRIDTDAAGLPVAVTDAGGDTTRYDRDGFGRITTITDPEGAVTRLGWTVDGKPAWRMLPDGATERWLYDGEGNLSTHIDALGQSTETEVTHFDLTSAEVRPDGTRLEFGYDTELRLTSVTNEQGRTWRYCYDPAGNLVEETDFNGRVVTYTHDPAGQLIERVNGAGESSRFVRDTLGNVIERRSGDQLCTFRYDDVGQLVEALDTDTQVTFHRNPRGNVLAETINGRTVTSAYDGLGRRILRRTPSGAESRWEYDANSRPTALHTAGQTLRFSYDAAGREIERRIGENAVLAHAWDANHRMRSQTLVSSTGRQVQHRSYDYRADGVLTGIDDQLTGTRTFNTDRLGRVTAVQAVGWSEHYAYDAAGNLVDAAGPTTLPDAEALGERDYAGTLIQRAGNVRYEHDAQGRLVLCQQKRLSHKPNTWRYFWDDEDRMTGVLTPDGTRWHYRYDPLGRRVAKQRLDAQGRVVEQTDFLWDGAALAEQAHSDGQANGAQLADARATVWEYEPGTFRPLIQIERSPLRHAPQQWVDERFYAIVTDLVGSPTELVNDQGGIAWSHRTTLWGSTVEHSSAGARIPLRFPGQYHDSETGFHYNYHRYYDPATGRYASTDPLGLAGGFAPHSYVDNPHTWLDPLGLKSEKCSRHHERSPEELDKLGKQAERAIDQKKAPRHVLEEINRIDRPEQHVPGSRWHAQGSGQGAPAINQDGTFRHGDPGFSNKTLKWLRQHGWNV